MKDEDLEKELGIKKEKLAKIFKEEVVLIKRREILSRMCLGEVKGTEIGKAMYGKKVFDSLKKLVSSEESVESALVTYKNYMPANKNNFVRYVGLEGVYLLNNRLYLIKNNSIKTNKELNYLSSIATRIYSVTSDYNQDLLLDNMVVFDAASNMKTQYGSISYSESILKEVEELIFPQIMDENALYGFPACFSLFCHGSGWKDIVEIEKIMKDNLKNRWGQERDTITKILSNIRVIALDAPYEQEEVLNNEFKKLFVYQKDSHNLPNEEISKMVKPDDYGDYGTDNEYLFKKLNLKDSILILDRLNTTSDTNSENYYLEELDTYFQKINILPKEVKKTIGEYFYDHI